MHRSYNYAYPIVKVLFPYVLCRACVFIVHFHTSYENFFKVKIILQKLYFLNKTNLTKDGVWQNLLAALLKQTRFRTRSSILTDVYNLALFKIEQIMTKEYIRFSALKTCSQDTIYTPSQRDEILRNTLSLVGARDLPVFLK